MKRFFHHIHSFFAPREDNNFHAKALHLKTLTVSLLFIISFGVIIGHLKTSQSQVLGFATDITTEKLLSLTNQQRASHNLSILKYNDKLASAAAAKAKNMFALNYWAHYAPDGTAPWSFILTAGYKYSYAGENLAKNFMFSQDVVTAWMNSPSHRENMLRPEYTDVGFAVANGVLNGQQTTLVVQMFGTPEVLTADSSTPDNPPVQVTVVPEQNAPQSVPDVLARQTSQPFNLMPIYVKLNYIFLALFIGALLTDFYLAAKLGVVRLTGKNIAHFIFILFMLIGLTIIIRGTIL